MSEWVLPVASVVLGGGFLGGIVLLLKVRPEAGSVAVMASEKVVVLQMGTIERLEDELEDLRKLRGEMDQLRDQLRSLQRQFNEERAEKVTWAEKAQRTEADNVRLRERVRNLEEEVARLRQRVEPTGGEEPK